MKGRQTNNSSKLGLATAKEIFNHWWKEVLATQDMTTFDLEQFNEKFLKSLNTPEINPNTEVEKLDTT